jgi:dihydrofolate synthase/folylpolyglutamate synthase
VTSGQDRPGGWDDPEDAGGADDWGDEDEYDEGEEVSPEEQRRRDEHIADALASLEAATGGRVFKTEADRIREATADLDDDSSSIVPDAPPLTLSVVETLLNRRWPETTIEPTLQRIAELMDVLGNPQRAYPVIQVAGTNGKTSVTRMIDALLSRLGLRTGRFISPHLQSVVERISLDNCPVDENRYVDTYADIAPYVDLVDAASARAGGVPLSKFEVLTGMAFAAFADAPVDAAVIETGIGGTWDSTTVADAAVAVVTPIGIDHINYLGPDLESIAGNKAGIIKPGATAVIGLQEPAAMTVLLRRAVEMDATVARQGSEFMVLERGVAVGGQRLTIQGLGGVYEEIFMPLHGAHQANNAALALAAVEAFFGAGRDRRLDIDAVQDAFAGVSSPGRLERVKAPYPASHGPTILIDAAHNPHGARALAAALAEEFAFARLIGVLAVMADKDVDGVLTALVDVLDEVVVTVNSSPRSLPVAELVQRAIGVFGEERVHAAPRMAEAIALAVDLAQDDPTDGGSGTGVLVTGSVVSAGDARRLAGLAPE